MSSTDPAEHGNPRKAPLTELTSPWRRWVIAWWLAALEGRLSYIGVAASGRGQLRTAPVELAPAFIFLTSYGRSVRRFADVLSLLGERLEVPHVLLRLLAEGAGHQKSHQLLVHPYRGTIPLRPCHEPCSDSGRNRRVANSWWKSLRRRSAIAAA